MSIPPINGSDPSTSGVNNPLYQAGAANGHQHAPFGSPQFINHLANKFISHNDRDGDGDVDKTNLSGLSQNAFNALDTDHDGKINANDIKTAVKGIVNSIKTAAKNGGPNAVKQYAQSLQGTAQGEVFQTLLPGVYGRLTSSGTTGGPQPPNNAGNSGFNAIA